MSEFSISSPDFEEGGEIRKKFGYKIENLAPEIEMLFKFCANSRVVMASCFLLSTLASLSSSFSTTVGTTN